MFMVFLFFFLNKRPTGHNTHIETRTRVWGTYCPPGVGLLWLVFKLRKTERGNVMVKALAGPGLDGTA